MDRRTEVALVAHRVRDAWAGMSEVGMVAQELGFKQLAAESFELELKLVEFHRQLIKVATQTRIAPSLKQPTSSSTESVPF